MIRRPSSTTLGALLILGAAVGFGTLGPMTRYADAAHVSSFALATWRAGIGALIVLVFLAGQSLAGRRTWRRWRELPVRDRIVLGFAAATNAGLNMAAFVAFLRIGIALTLLPVTPAVQDHQDHPGGASV